jgi:predicted nucleic acid-binding protein
MGAFAGSRPFMPSPAIPALLSGSRGRLLLLDSNLLLLWITARFDMRLLATFKRVQMFTQADAFLLAWIIDQFKSVVTTTHVVTEVSNLGNSLSSQTRFALLSDFSSNTLEETHSLNSLATRDEFVRFGITDCALSSLAGKYQVLTTDHRFPSYATNAGMTVLNFNDIRQMV